jgi:uncharacterized membrane protein YfcA
MDISAVILFLFCGLLSGLMNTLASSGSAITLPTMVFLGVPPSMANATNRLPILVGSTISVYNFQRSKEIIWSKLAKLQLANVLEFYVQINGNRIEIVSFWDNRQDIENRKINK